MPELEAKIKIAPNTTSSTIKGTSHHFFSCRANSRNSFNRRHMSYPNCKNRARPWQDEIPLQVRQSSGRIAESFEVLNTHAIRQAQKQVTGGFRAVFDVTAGCQGAATGAGQNQRQ